jgi:PAS domain S-box-containing protein
VEAKKQLTELEERTRLAVDANEIGIYDANLLTGEVVFSEKMHQLYGFNHPIPKEFYISMIHPDDLEVRKQAHEKAKQTGKLQYQYRVILQDGSVRWIDSHAKLYYNSKGLPYRRIGTIQDITALKNLVEKIGETEKKFRNTVMQAPVGILLTNGPQFVVEMVNEAYLQLVDRKEDDFTGKPLFESLPEVREAVEPLLLEVLNTGISYHGNEFDVTLNRFGKKEIAYFNFVYQPLRGQNGSISGVMVIASEVTKQVTTRFALQESREQFSKMVMQSPIAMTIWRGPDLIIEIANNALMENIWRKKPEEVIGKKALDVFPELVDQKYPALLGNVMATGIAHREKESVAYVQGNDGVKKFYLDVEYAPLYENDGTVSGVMITVNDVTERVEVRRQFQAAEERLRLAAEGTGLATWDLDIATRAIIYSPRLATIFGHSESAQLTHTQLRERIIEQDRRTIVEPAFEQALETGFYFYEARVLHPDNIIRWARMQGKVVYDENQQPVRMLGTALDVTEDKVNEEKLQRLAAIVQTSGDAIISKTIDGIITSWNDAAARMFNYTADEIIGQSILKLVPEEKKEEEAGIVERLKKGERIKPFESHGMTKEKKLIDISLTVSPLKGPRGQIVGASKIIRDITTQKEAERRINESEQKFRLLADSMPQFIWTSDPGGELNYFSKTMYDYSGLGPAAMEGKGWLQIVHPDDRPANIKQWLHCIKTGEPFLFEHRFRRYDGEYRWQLSRAVPQKDKKGKIQMWVGTSTDIDEIKKHDQQKDDFIKMASHELKTPVTTIKGYIQLLLKMNSGGDDPFLAGTLLTIDKQIYKLTKLITDLLDVTKIETGSLELNRETFFIADTVKEIAAELEITNQTHTIDIHQHANPVVYADRDRIAQVFTNLFTNAIKYSPRSNTIIVNISREENNVLISIKDFGIGISREDLARIFERFYRAAGKDEKTFPGFGIGLFIVNEIVSLHNGKVWAESEKDKGTIFYVLLPVRD